MSEYMDNINTDSYRNNARIYVKEITGQNREFIPLKLTLNSSNFNFDTVRQDGFDFRITETQNGTDILQMWVAYWNYSVKKATIWLKLPLLLANEIKTLYAFWGKDNDVDSSDLRYMLGESIGQEVVTSDNLCVGGSASGSTGTINPSNAFDGSNSSYCDIILNGWIQYSFSQPAKISMVRIKGHTSGWAGYGFEIRASNDNFVSEDVKLTDISASITYFWVEYVFPNDIYYKYYRIVNDKGQTYWRVSRIEMMSQSQLDIDSTPVFLFGDGFDGSTLDSNKWGNNGSLTISDSKLRLTTNSYVQSPEVLPEISNSGWIIEEGIVCDSDYTDNAYYAHRYNILGGENGLRIDYYANTKRRHNFEDSEVNVFYYGTNRGLESGSYSQNYIAYYEDTDKMYQGMYNRNIYINYDDEWERKVHRNTSVSCFRIYGRNYSSGKGVKIDWVIVREYNPTSDPEIDISELYIPYENIVHQFLDFTEYTSDITDVDYYHLSDMGGDPYKVSDNITNSISNIFISDTTTSGNLIIDFGRKKTNLVDNWYLHFDNNHVNYYNASKLSDLDEDIYNRNYWKCTTSSGVWAAIKFPNPIMVGCLSVRAVATNLDGMIKNFKFYGCNIDPRFAESSEKYLLAEGVFSKVSTEQPVYFTTGSRIFNYYILEANSSYGSNIVLQEWGMYELRSDVGKKVISQLRLHPAAFESNEYYFPKEIKFYGSNNMLDWTQLIDTTKTYTPFFDATYGRWQRYSFYNEVAYYNYKLVCIDNWYAQYDIMKIAEWEMVMRTTEEDTFRVLNGDLDNINNIWADNNATFEDGNVYITNDKLNVVMHNTLIESTTISGVVSDMNIRI